LALGHVSPEAAEGGTIALVRDGDVISVDIPGRSITLDVDERVLDDRRRSELAQGHGAWTPRSRRRVVSLALRAYAALTTSAARGAVRDVEQLVRN
jgi:dihydroxy-acid dehydratase